MYIACTTACFSELSKFWKPSLSHLPASWNFSLWVEYQSGAEEISLLNSWTESPMFSHNCLLWLLDNFQWKSLSFFFVLRQKCNFWNSGKKYRLSKVSGHYHYKFSLACFACYHIVSFTTWITATLLIKPIKYSWFTSFLSYIKAF